MLKFLIVLAAALLLPFAADAHPVAAKGGPAIETLRIDGGDLPHPVTVPLEDYILATDGIGSWYDDGAPQPPAPAVEPPPRAVQYRVEVIVQGGQTPAYTEKYVVGAPSLMTSDGAWKRVTPRLGSLIDRYIALDQRNLVSENPTLADALSAAARAFDASISADGRPLSVDTAQLLDALGAAQAVIFGMRGRLIGTRGAGSPRVQVNFGNGNTVSMIYVPPGVLASYGLVFPDSTFFPSWEYSTLLDPPAYGNVALSVPAEFDDEMAAAGLTMDAARQGSPLDGIYEWRATPLRTAQRQSGLVARVTVRAVDGAERDVDAALIAPFADIQAVGSAPVRPFSGELKTVEVWLAGIDPFPEAVVPAIYDYYPCDATGCGRGVLIQTQGAAIANATLGGAQSPFYAPASIDDALARPAKAAVPPLTLPGVASPRSAPRAAAKAAAAGATLLIVLACLVLVRQRAAHAGA